MITTRDLEVVDFISDYKIARTNTIAHLFYPSQRVAERRLRALTKANEIKRYRDSASYDYLYFKSKPKLLRHSLLITDFYREFSKLVHIQRFVIERDLGKLIPDAVIGYEYLGRTYLAVLEIEISNKGFDILKYENFYHSNEYKTYFPSFPYIIGVTNKTIPKTELKVFHVKEDLSDIGKVIGGR